MTLTVTVLQTALPVFAALLLGMLCRSRSLLSREGIDTLKNVVVNLTLPFVLFEAFATAEYSPTALLQPLVMFALCCLALVLGTVCIRLSGMKSRLAPFLAAGFEAGMLGYALFALLFPGKSMSAFALPDIGQTLFVFTLYKILLSGKRDLKAVAQDMAQTPILWAVAAGVLLGATGLYDRMVAAQAAGVLTAVTSFLGAPTGTVILLCIGYDLVLRDIPWKKTLGLIAMRLGVAAVFYGILIALNRTILHGVFFEGAALLMVILPPPYVIPVFADEPAERVQISSALSAMTVVTIGLFALMAILVGTGTI